MSAGEIVLAHAAGVARIHPLGATVLGYRPTGGDELLFVSPLARFQPGTAIRGGVPVCWPWFAGDGGPPAHGIARTRVWSVRSIRSEEDFAEAVFTLSDHAGTRAVWPHAFRFTLTVRVGASLSIALTHENTDPAPVRCTGALHAYLAVRDVAAASVEGLSGCRFHDKVTGESAVLDGPARFVGETDRVVAAGTGPVTLIDGDRRVQITRTGSSTVVLWNPGPKASAIVDLGTPDGFVCVEAANAGDDVIELAPGASHTLGMELWRQP